MTLQSHFVTVLHQQYSFPHPSEYLYKMFTLLCSASSLEFELMNSDRLKQQLYH
jgi:hypothetical protein